MDRPLLVFGTGSLAMMAHYFATEELKLNILGFIVDDQRNNRKEFCKLPVFNWSECPTLFPANKVYMFVALGYREMLQRQLLFQRITAAGYKFQNIISKNAFVAKSAKMGSNNIVMSGAVIEPGVSIGDNNVMWSNVTICHDSSIGCHNFFASNVTIGGEVTIGSRCFFGFTSTVAHQKSIGNDVMLAAQSLLLRDGLSLGLYRGIPAKRAKEISPTLGVRVS